MTKEKSAERTCAICHFVHKSAAEAKACEAQGLKENRFQLGEMFDLPMCGGVTVEVIELIAAGMLDHVPGVLCIAIAGNIRHFEASFSNSPQYFDQETALRYAKAPKTNPPRPQSSE